MNRKRWQTSLTIVGAIGLGGCSLFSRPDVEQQQQVHCSLRYAPGGQIDHDLEFVAWTRPYNPDKFLLSPLDQLIHATIAPGRHLSSSLAVEGAECPTGNWPKGYRLPMFPAASSGLRCTRLSTSYVRFRVETKWGSCTASIAEGENQVEDE